MQKMIVPIVGTGVVTADGTPTVSGAPTPPAQPTETPRQSLHNVRMAPQQQAQPELKGEFDNFGRLKWTQVQPTQEPAQQASAADVADVGVSVAAGEGGAQDEVSGVPPLPSRTDAQPGNVSALERQIQDLTQTVNILAQAQLRGMQPELPKPVAPQPPDPSQVDWLDSGSVAEFYRLNNAYVQAAVRHEVDTAMAPHSQSLQDARLNAQYNGVYAQYGHEPNFKERMGAALQLAAKIPGISIPQAFDAVGGILPATPQQPAAPAQPTAKPAQRTMTAQEAALKADQARRLPASHGVNGAGEPALPATLNNTGALGRIMFHNQQTGRARPIGN